MATNKHFNEQTSAPEVADAFSDRVQGEVVLIVGVSPNSLGESMALAFASHSPSLLVLASRTLSKIQAVVSRIRTANPLVSTKAVEVDLSSQSSVRGATAHAFSTEGVELQFATSFLGPFLLINLLMLQLLASAEDSRLEATRVINVISAGHRLCPIRFSDINFRLPASELPQSERSPKGLPPVFMPKKGETYNGFQAYGQSKTANVLFSVYLSRHLKGRGIASYAVHPGSIWTNLSRNLDEEMTKVISTTGGVWKDLDQGSTTMMVAALDQALSESDGCYLSDCQLDEPPPHASDIVVAERLWRLGEQLVGERLDLDMPGGAR